MNLKNQKGSNLHIVFKHWAGKYRVTFTEAEFLGEIQTKVLRVFLLVNHSRLTRLYSFDWDFYISDSKKLTQSLTVSVQEKGRKPYRKTYPLWFKKSMQKPQIWELSRLCPETSTWLCVHEFRLWGGITLPHLTEDLWLKFIIMTTFTVPSSSSFIYFLALHPRVLCIITTVWLLLLHCPVHCQKLVTIFIAFTMLNGWLHPRILQDQYYKMLNFNSVDEELRVFFLTVYSTPLQAGMSI
jgi:hypothetical protein